MTIINYDHSSSYVPRKEQQEIHKAIKQYRTVVVVAHRRLGKTVGAINQLIHSAWGLSKKKRRFAYVSPSYTQSKRIAWDILLEHTKIYKPIINVSELRVDFVVNDINWRINLYGAENVDALRGIGLDGAVVDEVADINPRLYSEVLRPALAENKGWLLYIGTPKGSDHFKLLRDQALKDKSWKLLEFKVSDTNIIDEDELFLLKKEMGKDKYMQEFECSFDSAITGAYYGSIINELEKDGRITSIQRDDNCQTVASWDLGISDSTAIWICQQTGQEVRLLDYVENHGVGLDWYINWLRENNWFHVEQLLPHDVQVRELGSGKSRIEVLQDSGLDCRVVKKLGIQDGIQATRRLLPRCWFNKDKVMSGVEALKNYRREFNDKQKVYYDRPLHDWTSHCADSFRYLAIGLDLDQSKTWNKPLNYNLNWVV